MRKLTTLTVVFIVFTMCLRAQDVTNKDGLYYSNTGKLYSGVYTNYNNKKIKTFDLTIVDGKAIGKVTYFYDNGSVSETGSFFDNEKNGEWNRFDEKGNKTAVAFYLNGKKDGTWTIWDFNGIKRCEMHYAVGEKTGTWKMWDENGLLSNEKTYSPI